MDDATRTGPLPSAIELARRITVGETSALAAVEASLARIAALDDALGAFCTVTAEQARREAQEIDRRIATGEAVGPLAGVPFAVKDLISTAGVRTTFGSPLYADNVPDEDDIVVERLRAAGAIMVGKTNTSEFGYGPIGRNPLFPPTRNPWKTELTPGGSSAGSSVAVATGMVPLALGSDGGGSIRIPASLNGIFGIKPSWGRVPVYPGCRDETAPGASGWEALEHIGPLTRTVADAALALSILSGPSPKDRHSLPAEQIDWLDIAAPLAPGLRIAFSADLGFAHVDPEVAAIVPGPRRSSPPQSAASWTMRFRRSAIRRRRSKLWWRSIPIALGCGRWPVRRALPSAERLAPYSRSNGPPTSSPMPSWIASGSPM